MHIVWTDRATLDLQTLRTHIAQHDPAAADWTIRRILSTVDRLQALPELGRPGRVAGTRELVVTGTPYLVPYRVRGPAVEIVRVLHGAQRWPKTF